jgi:signal transduction histidine kinase/CheY-like chemotaxis protein
MTWNRIFPWKWRRFIFAIALIAGAAALRVWPLQTLGSRLAWLTFYPVVMIAAIYGGFPAGMLATGLACLIAAFLGPMLVGQPFIKDAADWLGMAVFVMTGTMISGVAEAMRRAQTRAKQAQEKAEAANKAKSVFLASMSHELRTPLNAILGFSSLMRSDPDLSEEQRKTLDIINRSGEHLLNLINDVLDMAKVEAGRLSVDNSVLDLGEMVRDLTDLLRMRAEEKGLQLTLDQSSEFPRFVRVDADKLRQVLINLVGNAIKFTKHGAVTLRLNTRPAESPERLWLVVVVEDTGVGIATNDRTRIFDPFVQVGKQNIQRGTGLGLAIVHTYLDLMGGKISVESTPDRGSVFRVELPVERVDESGMRAAEIGQGRIVGLEPGQPEYRLLIIEDQMENWLLLQRLLEGVGFEARVAENGAAGIELFQNWRPHLIWMDIRMPIMDGLEATRRIRALDGGREVKIVALTASVFKAERDHFLAAGLDDFVRKPYRLEEIFGCLARQLGVRFVHKEDQGAMAVGEENRILLPEALATLPQELRKELTDALISLDAARINGIIRQVNDLAPELGKTLDYHTAQLGYTTILQALQSGSKGSSKEVL